MLFRSLIIFCLGLYIQAMPETKQSILLHSRDNQPVETYTDMKIIGSEAYSQIIELWKQRIRPLIPSHKMKLYLDLPLQISPHLHHLDFIVTRSNLQSDVTLVEKLYEDLQQLFEGTELEIKLLVCTQSSVSDAGNYKFEKIEPV